MLKIIVKQYQEEKLQNEEDIIDFDAAIKFAKFNNKTKLETLKFFIV